MNLTERIDRLGALRSASGFSEGYPNRFEAGRALARELTQYRNRPDTIVLALPRGGVPVAFEVALALAVPLDILVVKKIALPGYEEMAVGAAAGDGVVVLDEELLARLGVSDWAVQQMAQTSLVEVDRRERTYRNHRPPPAIQGQTVILVDDGLATGSTMRVAVAALRRKGPARIVVAVPVASSESVSDVKALADEVVCAHIPDPFYAVGLWYDDFSQTSDREVRALLETAAARRLGAP